MGPSYYDLKITKMENEESDVILPSGTFSDVLNCQMTVINWSKPDLDLHKNDFLYAEGVGKILFQYYYFGQYQEQKIYYEDRLVAYHIEE